MVEFLNITNYSYTLDNDSLSNETKAYIIRKRASYTFKDFIILLIDIFMVIGPSLGYFLQSLKFKKTKSSQGFSKSICLIIYCSHILRVFFWIGKPFRITLLFQSILIIIFQIYLIYLWVKYHNTTKASDKNNNLVNDLNYYDKKDLIEYLLDWSDTISPNKIWNWTSQIEYYKFMSLIVFFLLTICGIFGIHNIFLTNVLGTISVTSEASTLIPQIILACKNKKTTNLSSYMVTLWLIGDSCKFVYNIKYKTPIQMIISGGLQIFLDFFCLMQIICYRENNNNTNEINNVTIASNLNSKQLREINYFMNKLEEEFNENPLKKVDEEKNNDYNDNKKNVNKIEVVEKNENSEKVEVLDKSADGRIKYSDDEDNNNTHYELHEEIDKNGNNKTEENLKEEENEVKTNDI